MDGQPAAPPRRHFLRENIGLLVTYPEDQAGALADNVPAFLKEVSDRLPTDGLTLETDGAEFFAFPAHKGPPPERDASMKPDDDTYQPLGVPMAVIWPTIRLAEPGRLPSAREVVQLDVALRGIITGNTFAGLTGDQVSLNWMFSAGPESGIGTGGPGAPPVLYNGPLGSLPVLAPAFNLGTLKAAPKEGAGVKVVILDTAWPSELLKKAYQDRIGNPVPGAVPNALVAELLHPAAGVLRVIHMPDDPDRVRLAWLELESHPYPMPDHGLFVAGIIHTLAPAAKLVLVEVLNHRGVGDLISINRGLNAVAEAENAEIEGPLSGERLLINCSLCMDLPFTLTKDGSEEMLAIEEVLAEPESINSWLVQESLVMRRIVNVLYSQGHKIVAAAGNESTNPADRPQALFPAAFASVLGVGALPRQASGQSVSSYSNLSDTPPPRGIVTLGGEGGASNGVLGVYLGQEPPLSPSSSVILGQLPSQTLVEPDPTTSGWAWWAGTSFATPIVTGVLARNLGEISLGTAAGEAVDELIADPALAKGATAVGEDKLDIDQPV
jgi:hypothetical protein